MIWKLSFEPRTIEVVFSHDEDISIIEHVELRSPVPAPLQTCREARNNLGLYYKKVLSISKLEEIILPPVPHPHGGEGESENKSSRRYVWLNLEIDLIDVGELEWEDFFGQFPSLEKSLQRLKFGYDSFDWWDDDFTPRVNLGNFANLKELHIVCLDGFRNWARRRCWSGYKHWPCGKESVLFSEGGDDRTITGIELERGDWDDADTGRTVEETLA